MTQRRKATSELPAAGQAERLYQALDWNNLNIKQLARRAGLKEEVVRGVLNGRGSDYSLAWLVSLAHGLSVDPRWLVLGMPSAAGEAARVFLLHLASRNSRLTSSAEARSALAQLLEAVPEPDKGAGVCRYCLCTDELGCGNCEWVNEEATICSTCLDPEED